MKINIAVSKYDTDKIPKEYIFGELFKNEGFLKSLEPDTPYSIELTVKADNEYEFRAENRIYTLNVFPIPISERSIELIRYVQKDMPVDICKKSFRKRLKYLFTKKF